jgi:hypothetical protein
MQTFLPYPSFAASARALDTSRLGKQRVETLQILRALEFPDYGWQSHPAVRMWRGRTAALVRYGLDCVAEWTARGHGDSTAAQILEFAPSVEHCSQQQLAEQGLLPAWLGDQRIHLSHQSQLLAKDPLHYRSIFTGAPEGLDYFWPEPGPAADPAPVPVSPDRIWVLRPETPLALAHAVAAGTAGFGALTGVGADVTGHDLDDLRALAGVRRPTRGLRALADLVTAIESGDDLGVLISAGRSLLIGTVTGPYHYAPKDPAGVLHQRPVRWERVLARAALPRPAALQDVRPLFQVHERRS